MHSPVAIFVTLTLCALLAGCRKENTEVLRLERELDTVAEALRTESHKTAALLDDSRRQRASLDRIRADMGRMHIETETIQAEQEAVEQAFMSYHMDYQRAIWAKAPNMKLGNIITTGHTYNDVTLRSIGWKEFVFQHQDGSSKVAVEDLPERLRKFFGLELPEPLAYQTPPLATEASNEQGTAAATDTAAAALPSLDSPPSASAYKGNSANSRRSTSKNKPSLSGAFSGYKPVGKNYKTLWNDYQGIGTKR
jgi:hypothetical protein